MQSSGLRANQVSQVRGYADQKLRVPENPLDPSNRRISMIVQYLTVDPPPIPASGKPPPSAGPAAVVKRGSRKAADQPIPAPGSEGVNRRPPSPRSDPAVKAGAGQISGQETGRPAGSQAPQSATKPAPIAKPSAAKPATGNMVSQLWHKVRGK